MERVNAHVLARGARELGVDLAPAQCDALLGYLDLLARWNRSYNLTAVRDPEQMVTRHLLDCLAVAPLVRGARLVDVGSGAGLPGLVLALALPHVEVTLLDPSLKRTRFLNHAVQVLGPANVRVTRQRVEQFRPDVRVDTMTSRAALGLDALVAAAPGLLAPGGRLVAMLGRSEQARLAAALPPGFTLTLVPLAVPGLDAQRHAAVVQAAVGA